MSDEKIPEIVDPINDPPRAELEPPSDRVVDELPAGDEQPAVEEAALEHAFKDDKRNAIYAKRSEILAGEQAASDTLFEQAAERRGEGADSTDAEPLANQGESVKIIVYGEERQVPRVEVEQAGGVAAYQKAAAADQRFRQVAAREATLQAQEERLLRVATNLRLGLDENGQPLAATKPPSTEDAARSRTNAKEKAERAVKALFSGDTAEATAAMQEVFETLPGGSDATPEIVKSVEDAVLARIEVRRQADIAANIANAAEQDRLEANRIFREDFREVAQDPDTLAMARGLASTLAADPAWAGKGQAAIAREVGVRIKAKFAPNSLSATLQDRRNAKRDMSTSSAGGRKPAPAADTVYPSNQSYIRQLQANSGSNSTPRR